MKKISTITVTTSLVGLLLAPAAFAEQERDSSKAPATPQTHQYSPTTPAPGDPGMQKPSVPAEHMSQPGQRASEQMAQPGQRAGAGQFLKASNVIGFNVKNKQGEELGEIEELVIDPQDGRIAYAVLSVGGFLGMGDKLFAIPWETLTPMAAQETLTLDIEKERLAQAPGFDKNHWPDMANREWRTNVHKYYEQKSAK